MTSLPRSKYDAVAMSLHWLTAAIMVFMLFMGENMMDVEDGGGTFRPSLHVTLGASILILALARLAWRMANPPPPLPASMSNWERLASKLLHVAFYALMIGLPLSGWLAFPEFLREEAGMAGVTMFGLFPVPGAPSLGLPFDDLHEIGSKLGIALLVLHVLAALKHHFVNHDDVLRRMLPH